jgi:hypothetical protein
MSRQQLFTSPVSRTLAATLGVLVTAVVVTAGMASYLPLSQANQVVLPIILFPLTWFGLFIWALLDQKIWRPWAGLFALSAGHLLLILASVGKL